MIPNRRLLHKSSITTFLLIAAVSGILSFSGISINLNNTNTQAQAQEQQQVGQIVGNTCQPEEPRISSLRTKTKCLVCF